MFEYVKQGETIQNEVQREKDWEKKNEQSVSELWDCYQTVQSNVSIIGVPEKGKTIWRNNSRNIYKFAENYQSTDPRGLMTNLNKHKENHTKTYYNQIGA